MTERMEGGTAATVSLAETQLEKQALKGASQCLVAQALAAVFDKEGGVARDGSVTLPGISGQVHDSGGMQGHEAGLLKLGFADAETARFHIQHDIDHIKCENLAPAKAG